MTLAPLQIVVISGLSGSGKSVALHSFEDLGFFCIDNLPPQLLMTFIDLCADSSHKISRVALGVDIREGVFLENFFQYHRQLMQQGRNVTVVFLEASDEVLLRRFSESRRPHPLANGRPIREAIDLERARLGKLRADADRVIDTSRLTIHQLKAVITNEYRSGLGARKLQVTLISFGYKNGIPSEADLLFDTRCLPNPYFNEELKHLSGESEAVSTFLLSHDQTTQFLDRLCAYLDFLLPQYEREGRAYLNIGIGCTGGQHRSVVTAIHVARHLTDKGIWPVIRHRDLQPSGGGQPS
ncbi:MAG TPA: RNase adapter RapZ [Nitrospiria bacterium]|nr:RNase adapter RapZ [Nitrospiria bacterium]